jgi:hypothetical protein
MTMKLRVSQRNMLVFALIAGDSESSSGCHNISIGTTVPKGVEWYL